MGKQNNHPLKHNNIRILKKIINKKILTKKSVGIKISKKCIFFLRGSTKKSNPNPVDFLIKLKGAFSGIFFLILL